MGNVITVKCPSCGGPMIKGNSTCSNCIDIRLTSADLFGDSPVSRQVSKKSKSSGAKQVTTARKVINEDKDVSTFTFFNKKNAFYSEAVVVNCINEVCDIDISKFQGHREEDSKWGLPYQLRNATPKKWLLNDEDLRKLSEWKCKNYLKWLLSDGSYLLNDIQELKGKRLGDSMIPYAKNYRASVAAQQPEALGRMSHGHVLIDILKNGI